MKSAVVIGAGFAGLSSALELARRGVAVQVFEQQDAAGGRACPFYAPDGVTAIDPGPTLIVMIDVLRHALGDDAFAALDMRRLEPGYRVLWPDGQHFDMHSDLALWLKEVTRRQGGHGAAEALKYLALVHEQSTEARRRILETELTAADLLKLMLQPGPMRPWVAGNLRRFAERHFRSPRVVEALTFQPLYLGMSPSRSPAVYALLAALEVVGGVWYAPGGTARIVEAFVDACARYGVAFHYRTAVSRVIVDGGRAVAVEAGPERVEADAVIVASDREPSLERLFGERPRKRVHYGHSALVFYAGVNGSAELPHHTVLLPDDPWKSYAALDAGHVPGEPLIYVCNPAATNGPAARAAPLSILVPVPNSARLSAVDHRMVWGSVVRRLERHTGPLAERITVYGHRGPAEFARDLGLAHGAAFGPDHRLLQMGPFRPGLGYRSVRNVAFAGSGTIPGSGVPMVIISGRLAAQRVLRAAA